MTTAVTVTAQTLPEEAFATLVSLPTTTNISRSHKNASQILSRIVTRVEGFALASNRTSTRRRKQLEVTSEKRQRKPPFDCALLLVLELRFALGLELRLGAWS